MQYSEHIPSFPLNRWVEKIWCCSAESFSSRNLTLPFLHPELVFNFSEQYGLQESGTGGTKKKPSAWISGLQHKAYYSSCEGRHQMAGVLFKLNGLKAFTDIPVCEFSGYFTDARLVFGKQPEILMEKMEAAAGTKEKISLLEQFLLENLHDKKTPVYLDPSLSLLGQPNGKGAISAVCKSLHVSNKSLIGAFHKYIGLGPAKYVQLLAVNRALHLLKEDPEQSLTGLAYRLHFFDQAHFISTFKAYTTLTPSGFAQLLRNKQADEQFPNFISLQG